MQDSSERARAKPATNRLTATLHALVRTRITAGIVTILPLLITFWVVRLVFEWMRDASGWAVKALLLSPAGRPYLEQLHFDFDRWERLHESGLLHIQELFFELMPWHVRWGIGLFSVLLTALVLYAVGVFAANLLGRRLIIWVEQLLERVPFIKTIYRGLKQVLSSFTNEGTQRFQRVAMFPYLSPGIYSIGFVTSVFRDPDTDEEFVTIFYATTPNPTTGFVLILRRNEIVELDWNVEEAVRVIMSGGILMPEQARVPRGIRMLEGRLGLGSTPPVPPPPPAGPRP